MSTKKPTYEELKKKLAKTEALLNKTQKNEGSAKIKRHTVLLDTKEYLEAYKASEQNFKNSMDASPLGIRIMTADGALIYANQAILDICGYKSAQEFAAVPRSKLYTPESYHAHIERKKKRALKEYVPLEYEIGIQRPDGEVRNLQVFRREVMWGGEQQFMALYQDITERKRAEEALGESENRFHTIVERGNDGIVFVQDGIILYCNSKMLEIVDYTEAEVIGKPFLDFIAPESKKMMADIYRKRIAGEKVQERYEANLVGKNGRTINTEISASLANYKQETVDIAIVRDITARKKAEKTLIDEATRRHILIEQSRDGIVILNQDGNVFEVNQRLADMLGYTPEEVRKLKVYDWEFLYPKERVVEMVRTVDEKGDHFESQHRRKDGTIYDVEISTNGAMFGGQKLIFCVCRDITERKQAEAAVKESEELLKEAQTLGKIGSWEFDIEKQTITWSEETYALYERDPKDGPPSEEEEAHYYPPEQAKILRNYMAKAVQTKQTISYDLEAILPSQRRAYYHSIMKPVQDAQGKVFKLSGTVQDITERKQMEQSIRESEEKFSKAFNSSPEMMVIVNVAEDRYIEVNDSFARNLRYSREELIGHKVNEFNLWVYPEEKEKMDRLMEEQGKVRDEEFRFRTKNGEVRTWLCSADTLDIGGVHCMLGTFTDITERRNAQEGLRASEERFHQIFQQGPLGVMLSGLDFQIQNVNAQFCKMLGYTEEEFRTVTFRDFTFPEDIGVIEENCEKLVKGDLPYFQWDKRAIKKNKEIIWENLTITLLRDNAGKPLGYLSMIEDITERKQAEQALKESQEMFSLAFRNSPVMVLITTLKEGRVVEVNDIYCRITGYSREELIGHSTLALNLWQDPEQRNSIIENLKRKSVVSNIIVKFRIKTGDIRLLNMAMGKITLKNEPCLITIAEDITERRKTEVDLERERQDIKLVMDTSRALIWYKDRDGKFLRVNRVFAEALNLSEKDFIGKTVFDLYSKDIAQSMTIDDREVFISGAPKLNIVEQYESATGLRWVQTDKVPVLDNTGKPVAIIGFAQDITVQEIAREALKNREEFLNSIIENTPNALWVSDEKGTVIRMNQALRNLLNLKNEEVVGKYNVLRDTQVIEQGLLPLVKSVFEEGKAVNFTLDYHTAKEKQIKPEQSVHKILEITISAVKDEKGKVTNAICQENDITARKQSDEAIKESEERFRTLFETMAQGVIYHDSEGKVISANLAAQRILGLTLDAMVGKTSLDPKRKRLREDGSDFPSEEHPSILALRTGKPVNNVIMAVYNPVDKEYRWIINSAIPEFRRGEKKPYRVYTAFTDITGRKQGEQRINYLNQTLRSIRNINQLITREKDRDKLLQGVCDNLVESRSFSMAWIALFDEAHRLSTYAHSGVPGDFSPVVEAIKQGNLPPCVEKALKKNQVIVIEDPSKCVDCQMFEKSLNYGAMSIRLEYAGNIYGALCASLPKDILVDKDEASLFQEIANDISFALYNMDLQFDHEHLEQERLRAAKLESIGTLAGGIAHDFNNLLMGIIGNIGMVKTKTNPTEATYEMLEEAEKAALRARDLTQQLLTFAKGGKPIKKSVLIAEIIKESATFALRGSKAKLEISLPGDLWPVEVDEGQVSQVINNLVLNADEAMPEGGILKIQAENETLKKTAVQLLPGGDYVRIDIADTGIGISTEHLQRIFEPYFTTKQRGSGLGLTSAYSVVRNHGGIILADSTLNKGSSFHIYLPATNKPLAKGGKRMTAEKAGQAGGENTRDG